MTRRLAAKAANAITAPATFVFEASMKKSYAPTKAAIVCLTALSIGPLILDQGLWRFDRRFFSHRTVNELIGLGLAVRVQDVVRKA